MCVSFEGGCFWVVCAGALADRESDSQGEGSQERHQWSSSRRRRRECDDGTGSTAEASDAQVGADTPAQPRALDQQARPSLGQD